MKIKDMGAWELWVQNSQDAYGAAIIRYVERWANLMEERMSYPLPNSYLLRSRELEEIAKQASRDADTEGITVFMYGAAVAVLATVWEHGEQLRRWHNLETQLRDEGEVANESGGVLNPAVLRAG